jgi:hypothetical protein
VSGQYPSWVGALAASVTMIFLGVRTRMLSLPEIRSRCSACGRLVWRSQICRCTRDRRG